MTAQEARSATADRRAAANLVIRRAMLSVYYHALGRELTVQGAPAVMLPPEVEPLSLRAALRDLKPYPDHLRHAAWTIIRGVPVSRFPNRRQAPAAIRYPLELQEILASRPGLHLDLDTFDARRGVYRCGSHLFAAALIAYAQEQFIASRQLAGMFAREQSQVGADAQLLTLSSEAGDAFGPSTPIRYLDEIKRLRGKARFPAAESLANLECEVGLPLYDFTEHFADTIAFLDMWPETKHGTPVTVYPAAATTVQDTTTLGITVTVTAFVSSPGGLEYLAYGIDPRSWTRCSQVFTRAEVVRDAFTLAPQRGLPPIGAGWQGEKLVDEEVLMIWGLESDQVGRFHNVLRAGPFSVDRERGAIDLPYCLERSISSRVLWDERAGGLLVNQGYVKARHVIGDLWRVTTRKVLQFSDRAPNTGGSVYDFGEMLSLLAPAALNWWLETEMYGNACPDTAKAVDRRRKQA